MLLLLAAPLAHAADQKEDKPEKTETVVKVSGTLYPRYSLDLSEDAGTFNAFDIDRSYLRADAKLTDRVAVRLTLDANRMSASTAVLPDGTELEVPADTRLRVFVKHAWVEYKPIPDLQLRAGMVDTPYLPFEEQLEGLRYVFKVFLDDVKLESTTDFGLSASGKHAGGLFSWGAGVYNGEFYTSPEIDAGKSIQARVAIDPLAEPKDLALPIALFVDEELHTGADPTTVVGGLVGFQAPWLTATAQVDAVREADVTGLGQSVLVQPKVPDVLFFVGRVDHFDPDGATDDDGQIKVWGGLGRDFMDKVSLVATYERTMLEAEPDAPVQAVVLHAQAGF